MVPRRGFEPLRPEGHCPLKTSVSTYSTTSALWMFVYERSFEQGLLYGKEAVAVNKRRLRVALYTRSRGDAEG